MIKKYIIGSTLAAFALVGCNSGSDTSSEFATTTGYLVDSAIENANYDCVADAEFNKKTGADGAFTCRNMNQVRFRIGNVILGEITSLPEDRFVFPQDLAGLERNNLTDPKVIAMARLLQTLDEDNNVSNGLKIPENIKDLLVDSEEDFNEIELDTYIESASIEPERIRTETQAREHLRETMQDLLPVQTQIDNGSVYRHGENNGTRTMDENGSQYGLLGNGHTDSGDQNRTHVIDVDDSPLSTLTDELKYTLAYMWNEEKLAKDIYLALNAIHPTQQLENIATKAETQHQALVEELIEKYDINITNLVDYTESYSESELRSFTPGEFALQEIKDMYDALYAKGSQSKQDALEVGCMVEVVDVNDLTEDIAMAQEENASDLVAVFSSLRDGSYSHYWAFDKGLKNMGIEDGCCSLGTIDGVDYCQPDYPQNSRGKQ